MFEPSSMIACSSTDMLTHAAIGDLQSRTRLLGPMRQPDPMLVVAL